MKDVYCSYYTESEDITSYMVSKMGILENDFILEPSAGEGMFIDEILKRKIKVRIDALDINEAAILTMKKKYSDMSGVNVRLTDTLFDQILDNYANNEIWLKNTDILLDKQLDLFSSQDGHYDKVIGNPPYGAWQDIEKRELLKKKYVGQYVKETYTLFLLRSLSVLKNGGRLSFIVPDTFLFLNMHEKLRKILLTNTKIEEVLIFPSKFFPGVSFGYSNLSIITLEKCDRDEALENTVRIIKGFSSSAEFKDVLRDKFQKNNKIYKLKQLDIFTTEKSRFILADDKAATMIDASDKKLGDMASIVTGFYSGNNKKFICSKNEGVKNSKGYTVVDESKIVNTTSLIGVDGVDEAYVPYIKSSSATRYKRTEDQWFVRWDSKTVSFYNVNRKARFQNSQFYFKNGIAIPMVKSKEIRATLMRNRIFDQSIVGIFPNDEKDMYYILALMNSDVINRLIHIINPTANNSSNYVKQLPYKVPTSKDRKKIEKNVAEILSLDVIEDKDRIDELHKQNNELIENTYN
ncbi:class I SAM-dependent methyltransferase [Eubacterium sp. MSJ-13]|uniref:Eco57I restriction-modification methylase domain-containing protein n=1 Tax=Eubacterium sp. MSJ-13 TaxID=2841513 RepID=UPI001C107D93|nr:N-6 DNA methylase [Eubacterium sp. MSJ-13]MBU5478094.1 class I SAM-dependent methyltransferase [Eubacterium sp. MSJ-13]